MDRKITPKYKCPCCGCYTFDDAPQGTYDICPVCFWEDDLLQNNKPDFKGGANRVSLNKARENYKKYGACEERFVQFVRKPNEKEKAQAGMLYNANYDETLAGERLACKDLCAEYNKLMPSQTDERKELLKRLLGKTGENFWIEQSFWCDYGYNIEIGENFYSNHNLVILDAAKVKFGNNCFVAPNCGFYTAGHPLDAEQRNEGLEIALPITIGDNVWIGGNAAVMPGVTIGSNSVIGGGSVVVKDIPEGVVAAGNPCRVIRKITQADKDKYKRR